MRNTQRLKVVQVRHFKAWFTLVHTGLHWFTLVCTGSHWFALVHTGLHWFALVHTVSQIKVVITVGILPRFNTNGTGDCANV